jgi:hypothetical protein
MVYDIFFFSNNFSKVFHPKEEFIPEKKNFIGGFILAKMFHKRWLLKSLMLPNRSRLASLEALSALKYRFASMCARAGSLVLSSTS